MLDGEELQISASSSLAGLRSEDGELPVSSAQSAWLPFDARPPSDQRSWFVVHLDGYLNARALRRALQHTCRRHDILRTRYREREGAFVQHVAAAAGCDLPSSDLSRLGWEGSAAAILDWLEEELSSPLGADPTMLRIRLFRRGDDRHVLAGYFHHIVSDWISAQVFWRDLLRAYDALVLGLEPQGAPAPQYTDFVRWESGVAAPRARSEAFWSAYLDGAQPTQAFGGTAAVRAGNMERAPFEVPLDTFAAMAARARKDGLPLSVFFLAAMGVLIGRRSGEDKVMFGHYIHGRPRRFADAMGCFTQLRPLVVDLRGAPSVGELLQHVRAAFFASSDLTAPPGRLAAVDDLRKVRVNILPAGPGPMMDGAPKPAGLTVRFSAPLLPERRVRRMSSRVFGITVYLGRDAPWGHIGYQAEAMGSEAALAARDELLEIIAALAGGDARGTVV